jgi:hypothetical protein
VRVIGWMIRSAFYALAIAAFAYVAVFVPVGRYTLYGHASRIVATPEAKELGASLGALADEGKRAVLRQTVAQAP